MIDKYKAKRAAHLARIELLKKDQIRVADKLKAAQEAVKVCEAKIAELEKPKTEAKP